MAPQIWTEQLAVLGSHRHHGVHLIILLVLIAVAVGVTIYFVRRAERPQHLNDDWIPPVTPRQDKSTDER